MSSENPLPLPDTGLHPVGSGSAEQVGGIQKNLMVHFGLTPGHTLLDLGCGIGRLTYVLGDFFEGGEYHGLDISEAAIRWLRENYSSRRPHFRFEHLDVHNARYNPRGVMAAEAVELPYASGVFDRICAFSVFTHMMPVEISRYLSEIGRTLKATGRAVVTFFAMDPEGDVEPRYNPDSPFFRLPGTDDVWTLNLEVPERGIGFSRDRIAGMLEAAGLAVDSFVPGHWRGGKRQEAPFQWAHQDVYVLRRA